jgi:hypothetical protein
MQTLSKEQLNAIREDINIVLKTVGDKYKMDISLGSISYQADSFTGKLHALPLDETGNAITQEKKNLELLGKMFLGEDFDVTKTFMHKKLGEMRVYGIKTRTKLPIVVESLKTGKHYLFTADEVKALSK